MPAPAPGRAVAIGDRTFPVWCCKEENTPYQTHACTHTPHTRTTHTTHTHLVCRVVLFFSRLFSRLHHCPLPRTVPAFLSTRPSTMAGSLLMRGVETGGGAGGGVGEGWGERWGGVGEGQGREMGRGRRRMCHIKDRTTHYTQCTHRGPIGGCYKQVCEPVVPLPLLHPEHSHCEASA